MTSPAHCICLGTNHSASFDEIVQSKHATFFKAWTGGHYRENERFQWGRLFMAIPTFPVASVVNFFQTVGKTIELVFDLFLLIFSFVTRDQAYIKKRAWILLDGIVAHLICVVGIGLPPLAHHLHQAAIRAFSEKSG